MKRLLNILNVQTVQSHAKFLELASYIYTPVQRKERHFSIVGKDTVIRKIITNSKFGGYINFYSKLLVSILVD